MTAPSSIDPAHFLHEQLAQASPDLLRQMLTTFIDTLITGIESSGRLAHPSSHNRLSISSKLSLSATADNNTKTRMTRQPNTMRFFEFRCSL